MIRDILKISYAFSKRVGTKFNLEEEIYHNSTVVASLILECFKYQDTTRSRLTNGFVAKNFPCAKIVHVQTQVVHA